MHYTDMTPDDFEKKMEGIKTPPASAVKEPVEIKLAILNAERSATMGIWFVVVPCFFIACIFMKYLFNIKLGFLDTFEDTISRLDKNPQTWWIQPVLLVGLPIIGIIINALSILHFRWDGANRSVLITLKIRWINIIILAISAGIVMMFLMFLMVENFEQRHG